MDSWVLILDDDQAVNDLLDEHLTSLGCRCTTVTTAKEAITEMSHHPFDALIADIVLGESDGLEVASQGKQLLPELVVVIMTGSAKIETAVRSMRIGADDYILKPFNMDEVSDAIDRGIEKRNLIRRIFEQDKELKRRVDDATHELQSSHLQLEDTQKYLNNLIDSTVDGIITVDMDDVIGFANRGAQRMLGYRKEEFDGLKYSSLLANGSEELNYLRRVVEMDRPLQNFETELRHHDGRLIPVSISFSLAQDSRENAVLMVAICKDITEQKRLEHELKEMTIRDSLTGLFNVRYFYERIEMEIDRAKRQGRGLSLLLVDVDKFKSYNDSRGHRKSVV